MCVCHSKRLTVCHVGVWTQQVYKQQVIFGNCPHAFCWCIWALLIILTPPNWFRFNFDPNINPFHLELPSLHKRAAAGVMNRQWRPVFYLSSRNCRHVINTQAWPAALGMFVGERSSCYFSRSTFPRFLSFLFLFFRTMENVQSLWWSRITIHDKLSVLCVKSYTWPHVKCWS